ncbi:MAG TPA: hypothetical protein DCF33_02510 [Saprospirales bacterium]|nr:hypothetical protein [Saprospirales bacterium]
MENRTYNIYLRDTLFEPNSASGKKATFKKYAYPDSKVLYKVWVYLDGKDLSFVQAVKYHLHPSFKVNQYQIERSLSNPQCALVIWTWGVFNVRAEVTLISGEVLVLNHYLTYPEAFSLEKEIEWVPASSGSLQH